MIGAETRLVQHVGSLRGTRQCEDDASMEQGSHLELGADILHGLAQGPWRARGGPRQLWQVPVAPLPLLIPHWNQRLHQLLLLARLLQPRPHQLRAAQKNVMRPSKLSGLVVLTSTELWQPTKKRRRGGDSKKRLPVACSGSAPHRCPAPARKRSAAPAACKVITPGLSCPRRRHTSAVHCAECAVQAHA